MKPLILPLAVAAALAIVCTPAEASLTVTVDLTTDQEPGVIIPTTSGGSPRPESYGTATFTLNDALTAMSFTATFFNIDVTGTQTADINDNLTAAHILRWGRGPACGNLSSGVGFFRRAG